MSYRKTLQEMLAEISITPEFQRDAVWMKYINVAPLKKLLSIIWNPTIEWDLPSGMPPHKRDETIPPDLAYTTLAQEVRGLYVFFKPSPINNVVKREARFIELIESLHYTETDLLMRIKDKSFEKHYPGVTMKKAYEFAPDIFTMDGLFTTGEWLLLNGDDEIIKIVNAEQFNKNFAHYKIHNRVLKNQLTGEVYFDKNAEPSYHQLRYEAKKEKEKQALEESLKQLEEDVPKKRGRPKKEKIEPVKSIRKVMGKVREY